MTRKKDKSLICLLNQHKNHPGLNQKKRRKFLKTQKPKFVYAILDIHHKKKYTSRSSQQKHKFSITKK